LAHFSKITEPLLPLAELESRVRERDHRACVLTQARTDHLHFLLAPRLFTTPSERGGHYASNAVLLSPELAEKAIATEIRPSQIRRKAGIENVILPDSFDPRTDYDYWGNPYQGLMRLRGEYFFDPEVQDQLHQAGLLDQFLDRVKYPRTFHLPSSPGMQHDDRRIGTTDVLTRCRDLIVTEKLDGENITMARDYIHARDVDSGNHPSRHWVKSLWQRLRERIPPHLRLSGENLYARRVIPYTDLPSYFQLFGIWTNQDRCLSWDESLDWCQKLELQPVPVLYRGPWHSDLENEILAQRGLHQFEGFVMRTAAGYRLAEHQSHCAKWVRGDHVQEKGAWMEQTVIPNLLKVG